MKVSRRVRVDAEQRELTLLALNAPLGSDRAVQDIRDDTSSGTSDDVEETEPVKEAGGQLEAREEKGKLGRLTSPPIDRPWSDPTEAGAEGNKPRGWR
jgi:hypothetical protein